VKSPATSASGPAATATSAISASWVDVPATFPGSLAAGSCAVLFFVEAFGGSCFVSPFAGTLLAGAPLADAFFSADVGGVFPAGLAAGLAAFFLAETATTLPSLPAFGRLAFFFAAGLRARLAGSVDESTTAAVAAERRAAAAGTRRRVPPAFVSTPTDFRSCAAGSSWVRACAGRDELDDTNDLSMTGDQGYERLTTRNSTF
jgi:hypothetical protein